MACVDGALMSFDYHLTHMARVKIPTESRPAIRRHHCPRLNKGTIAVVVLFRL